jgi:dolichol-phosphate mannosyltransferase
MLKIQVNDLMSGFFMLRREIVEETVRNLSGIGFKILLDIMASSPRPLNFVELPYRFRPRQAGKSKLDMNATVALAMT